MGRRLQAVGYAHRLLIKALLRAIALAQSAPGHAARAQSLEAGALAACLCTIFQRARDFGGGVFSLGASVMRLIIHHDPTCFPQVRLHLYPFPPESPKSSVGPRQGKESRE